MSDEVVRAYHRPEAGINYRHASPKLGASVATMGLGAIAGMEGASKWLGGTIRLFKAGLVPSHTRRRKGGFVSEGIEVLKPRSVT